MDDPFLADVIERARSCAGDPGAAADLAVALGAELPRPMEGRTLRLWEALASIAACNLTVARVIEPHLDALAILAQAAQAVQDQDAPPGARPDSPGGSWGVYAAEGKDDPLTASRRGDSWVLNGTKPWCSLAGGLSDAIVTARAEQGRRAFRVGLAQPGVQVTRGGWSAFGLAAVPSGPVVFNEVPATAVGGTDWYITRPGFAWGGAGVAAVWFGAATAIARRIHLHCTSREPDQIALMHLGMTDVALAAGRNALVLAAAHADGPQRATGHILAAARARAAVVKTAESILTIAGHAMGPEPLAFDADHAARVADLTLYLRQDHAERSLAAIGGNLLGSGPPW